VYGSCVDVYILGMSELIISMQSLVKKYPGILQCVGMLMKISVCENVSSNELKRRKEMNRRRNQHLYHGVWPSKGNNGDGKQAMVMKYGENNVAKTC